MNANCKSCDKSLPRSIAKCQSCGAERTHKDCYPEQYEHRLVGRRVKVRTRTGFETEGVVERVVHCRFGLLAHLDNSGNTAYSVSDCTPLTDKEENCEAKTNS